MVKKRRNTRLKKVSRQSARPSAKKLIAQGKRKRKGVVVIDHNELRAYMAAILRHVGSSAQEADIVAEHLVDTNLAGHDSHGVGMMPRYVANFLAGQIKLNQHVKLVREDGAFLQFDGQQGFGQVVAREATDLGIALAKKTGLAIVSLGNAHHIGRAGAYGERAGNTGLVSLSFVNTITNRAVVAPFGGTDGRYVTNPICFAIPRSNGKSPIVLDMATSIIAMGKVRVAMNEGRTLPPGKLLDHRGRPTRDPRVIFHEPFGALLPFGEHKGYGLALMCEILGGILSGYGTMQPETPRDRGIINNMLTFIFDPARLVDRNWFDREIRLLTDYVTASPPSDRKQPVLMPGDPERLRTIERRRDGIPIDRVTWTEIRDAAISLGMTSEQLLRWDR